jgi:purine-binding chemotaxis protein CheW
MSAIANIPYRQFLTFRLGREMFAIDVAQVREILDFTAITRVPRAPEFMRGVINVRGSVVPVVDLHVKFGLDAIEKTVDTRIVVMEIDLKGELCVIGALADAVHDVIEMEPGLIEAAPRIGVKWNTEFIRGIGRMGDDFLIILDVDRIFSSNELTGVVEQVDSENEAA